MKTLLSRLVPACLLSLAAVVAPSLTGCSTKDGKATIHGTITYQGQPLRSGLLKFAGPGGAYSAASIKSDGTFIITDVVPGEVKVGVVEAPGGSKERTSDPPVSLPEKYRDPATSELVYTITAETKELVIEIK